MLTPTVLRDMHKRIVEAHVQGFEQVSNWTVKDEPQEFTRPQCWFQMPLGVPEIKNGENIYRGLLCDAYYGVALKDDRSQESRDAAYNAMTECALQVLAKFVVDYVRPSNAMFNGVAYNLALDEQITFQPYADDGGQNMTGCRMTFRVYDKDRMDCTKLAAIFPSLA